MSTQLKTDPPFDDGLFQSQLPLCYRAVLRDFRKIASSLVLFHFAFSFLFVFELFLFFFLSHSHFIALAISALFLTVFSYFVLLFYLQAKKPEQLYGLKERFLSSCRPLLSSPPGEAHHHLCLAEALLKLSAYLHDFEHNFHKIPSVLAPFSRWIQILSARCYKEDVFHVKQLLIRGAIEEHFKQIRLSPTDLEVHASLANAYIALSSLYKSPSPSRSKKASEEAFRTSAQLAVEEFRILNYYAPNDPWVHEQLASGYRDLGMPENEILEMETLLKLRPQDNAILFRLGMLYFEQGQNAKGLQIYEELKQAHFKKAEELIANYGNIHIGS